VQVPAQEDRFDRLAELGEGFIIFNPNETGLASHRTVFLTYTLTIPRSAGLSSRYTESRSWSGPGGAFIAQIQHAAGFTGEDPPKAEAWQARSSRSARTPHLQVPRRCYDDLRQGPASAASVASSAA
jgi:hypothetical protein